MSPVAVGGVFVDDVPQLSLGLMVKAASAEAWLGPGFAPPQFAVPLSMSAPAAPPVPQVLLRIWFENNAKPQVFVPAVHPHAPQLPGV